MGRERLNVAGLELEPVATLGQQFLVGARREVTGTACAARARTSVPGVARTPSEASTTIPAAAIASSSDICEASTNRTRSRSVRPSVAGAASGREDQTVARHWESAGQQPQRTQERAQRSPLLPRDHHELVPSSPERAGSSAAGRITR